MRGHPSKCRGLRAVFCPVGLRSTLRIAQQRGGSGRCALRVDKSPLRNRPRSGLMMGTCGLLGGSCPKLLPMSVRVCGRVPTNTKLNNKSSSTTYVVGLLGSGFSLKLDARQVRRCTMGLKTSYTFFVQGGPIFTAKVKGLFRPIRLSLGKCRVVLVGPSVFISAQSTFTRVGPIHPTISLGRVMGRPVRA